MSKKKKVNIEQRGTNFIVKAELAPIAVITKDIEAACWLQKHYGQTNPDPNTRVLVRNRDSGQGARVNLQTAAYLLGLSVNGNQPGGKQIIWQDHRLWFVAGQERVAICDTRVPAPKAMSSFLRLAATVAGVDETDLARMFPSKNGKTVPVVNPVDDTGIKAEPGTILIADPLPDPVEEIAVEAVPVAA